MNIDEPMRNQASMIGGGLRGAVAFVLVGLVALSCGTTTTTPMDTGDAGCTQTIETRADVVPGPPDGVAACPSGACNYQAQTGCAAGLACRPQFSGAAPTVTPGCEMAGDGQSGASCDTNSQCAIGYFCVGKQCRKQCCGGDWSVCPAGEHCFRALEVIAGGQHVDSGLELCSAVDNCDPLDPAPCPGDPHNECKIVDATGAVACTPLSQAQEGDDCGKPDVCAAGLTCVAGACRKLCRAEPCGEPSCTAAEGSCVRFNRDPAGVGECTP